MNTSMDMDKSFFITLTSENNGIYKNSNSNFKVELDQPLYIQTQYEVALVDITLNTGNYEKKEEGMLFVTTNVCEEQHFNSTRIPLLRHFYAAKSRIYQYEFNKPHYIPVKHGILGTIEIMIRDKQGETTSFLHDTTYCTLHFRKRSR